tara:strand:+ start:176 stop:379 length:204 start_codon:yes stop_codon:yes gene_type:complete
MAASYYSMDPSFTYNSYPESGTAGYDGKGWYYFHDGQLCGPFNSERDANRCQQFAKDINEWKNKGEG